VARLVLVGLPGVGKTSVAKEIATHWHCDVLDTDEVFLAHVGVTPAAFLRTHDEPSFRLREVDALVTALDSTGIVATGGGIVCTSRGRALLAHEVTVWLDSGDEVLLERLGDVDRPLLGDDPEVRLAQLRSERTAWYEEVSKLCVDASGTLSEVARAVMDETKALTS
jgi:shikimate kinase